MVDFAVFDYLLDSVFIVDGDGKIIYCNEMAATFCQSSVRRLSGKAMLVDHLNFAEAGLLPFTSQSHGRTSPSPQIETAYTLPKLGKSGKTQLTVRPMGDEKHWVFFLHDVSLEETLAAKYKAELQKTEEYARNLEKLVEARTAELRKVNQTLNAILDSLGQGFFTFDAKGECGQVFTKACNDVLEGSPKDKKAVEMLGVPPTEIEQFQKWSEGMFKEFLPFDDMKSLGPNLFPHSQKRHVTLDYYPIRQEQVVSEIVVVATDKTVEFEAQKALDEERQFAAMVVKYMKNKDQFLLFLQSVRLATQRLRDLATTEMKRESIAESFRILHTIEGESGTFSIRELRLISRESQQILEPFKQEQQLTPDTLDKYRESLVQLERTLDIFLEQNKDIIQLPKGDVSRTVEVPTRSVEEFLMRLAHLPSGEQLIEAGQDLFLKEPIEGRIRYFEGLMQTVADRLGKRVMPLTIEGGDFRIYPEPYQKIFSAMVHAFRNAVDHGLEEPTEREFLGKNPAGKIVVRVKGGQDGLFLEIEDDGRGIDPQVIRKKLKEKFPGKDFTSQSDEEIIQNVCMPGFSSRESVGEFSGRGVGLDALREEVLSVGGSLFIESKVGLGTTLKLFIPPLTAKKHILRSA